MVLKNLSREHDPWSEPPKRDNNKENGINSMQWNRLKSYKSYLKGSFDKGPYKVPLMIGVLLIAALVIINGFYTLGEAERGVVVRFGRFHHISNPGINWKFPFDVVQVVNIQQVREISISGIMLTADENVVQVEMNVQYRIIDPRAYLFNVRDADESLKQATDSAVRTVIGKNNMDDILTEGRTIIRNRTQELLQDTIAPYKSGLVLLEVNFQVARPPNQVQAAFDDVIAARENEQELIRKAHAYVNEVLPKAEGEATRIVSDAKAYKADVIARAQGQAEAAKAIMNQYKQNPEIVRQKLYLQATEGVMQRSRKIIIGEGNKVSPIFLPVSSFNDLQSKTDYVEGDTQENDSIDKQEEEGRSSEERDMRSRRKGRD